MLDCKLGLTAALLIVSASALGHPGHCFSSGYQL